MREELVDRFGDLPDPARVLLDCHLLRILAKPVGVARIDATHEAVKVQFEDAPSIDPKKVVSLVQRRRGMRLTGRDRLRMEAKMPSWPERVTAVKDLLIDLAA
jgi:transcription-repair coupling factor (superfamily II helicase)